MPLKLENLCKQVQSLKKSQQQKSDAPDFDLEPCSGPLWDAVDFLEVRKLGPAGMSLLNALTGHKRLTEPQEGLLQKVLAKMGHPEYMEPILQELESNLQALAACDRESSTSALCMR